MDDSSFGAGLLLLILILFFAGIGFWHTVSDDRQFSDIAQQCAKQGYIQDKTRRIICKLEIQP